MRTREEAEDAVRILLEYIGEDTSRNGLIDTPKRVAKALIEMTSGYSLSPEDILSTVFEEVYDEVIILRSIPFTSLCEHHMLIFSGTVDIGYIPGKVVGISKLARLVDCFARRLQIQEKFTRQISEALMTHLDAKGAAVVTRASHSCMACRGVRKEGASMICSSMLGAFRTETSARMEFLTLTKN